MDEKIIEYKYGNYNLIYVNRNGKTVFIILNRFNKIKGQFKYSVNNLKKIDEKDYLFNLHNVMLKMWGLKYDFTRFYYMAMFILLTNYRFKNFWKIFIKKCWQIKKEMLYLIYQ